MENKCKSSKKVENLFLKAIKIKSETGVARQAKSYTCSGVIN